MTYHELTKGRFSQLNQEYLITSVTHNRKPIFKNFNLARILVNEFKNQQEQNNATWLSWIIMPDHFHILISLQESDLKHLMMSIKGRSARDINKMINHRGEIWQKGFYDRALRHEDDRKNIARYIVANPLRAGLVKHIGEYPHWDAIWL
ncbi:REP-associated tyrosine transposase [Pseudoalteromonas denitrificans]|jgi:REP element-mobilizing transposase RayT|uniref:REP element-mobilizing transposase RayT n=1 Tax=Pseudoalteromonas denitrificans DSM 6059 TaxID=1123010 RepID=A0A1I1VCI9_9GAMM|nr:transposase [Pseudoalteromonas denitrificans]SFD78813.1 REP element-mobilizing transposase RayT [Pseudoalteromonas denitrificans DSM 6059]